MVVVDARRPRCGAQGGGDLLVRHPLLGPQEKDLALLGRQPPEFAAQAPFRLDRLDLAGGVGRIGQFAVLNRQDYPPATPPMMIPRGIGGYPVEPPAEARLTTKGGDRPEGAEKGLLEEIVHVGQGGSKPSQEPAELGRVPPNERSGGRVVALLKGDDEFPVVGLGGLSGQGWHHEEGDAVVPGMLSECPAKG